MLQDRMQFLALLESLSLKRLSVNVVVDYHVQNIRRLRQMTPWTFSSTTWVSKRTVTVGSDRAVLSGILQIVTSTVRDFCTIMSSRVSREVYPNGPFPLRRCRWHGQPDPCFIRAVVETRESPVPQRTSRVSYARWCTRQKLTIRNEFLLTFVSCDLAFLPLATRLRKMCRMTSDG